MEATLGEGVTGSRVGGESHLRMGCVDGGGHKVGLVCFDLLVTGVLLVTCRDGLRMCE